jgi:hypothetical protein
VNTLLLDRITAAVKSGAIPTPLSGESIEDYKFRAAHAGALIGICWYGEILADQVAEQALHQDNEGRHGGATVTSPVDECSARADG